MEKALGRVLEQVHELGLERHLVELDTVGYTVLPGVLDADLVTAVKAAIVARVERDTGKAVDLDSGDGFTGQQYIPYLLYDDEVYERVVMAEKPLALMTYLLGESCLLSSVGCHFKGPGGQPLLLHSDNGNGMPAPFPAYSQVANINYALTPYSREAGALAMVPGSHHLARPPTVAEMQLHGEQENRRAIAMDLAPGDCVVWHGNTWHGSYIRELPGIRMNLAVYMCRQYLQTQEQHRDAVPETLLARQANNERLLTLLGAKQPYGWQADGPDYTKMARNPRGLFD